jgi:glycosyltransferase 2 family protein
MATLLAQAAGSLWFRLLITAGILGYLATQIDMTAAGAAVVRVSRTHLAAVLALVALDRAVMILRWVLLLRASNVDVSTSRAVSIFLTSSFVGSFLPAGVGGDLARAYGLSRAAATGSEAVASVAIDRVLGVLSLLVMGIIGLVAWTPDVGPEPRAIVGVILLAAVSTAAFYADRVVRAMLPESVRPSTIGRRLLELGEAVARYRARRGVLVQVFGWSLVVQVLRITQAYLLGLGLAIAVPFRYYLLFMPVGLLMLLLPISVSGFGLPQGVIVWLLRPMGVPDEQSFALSTLIVLTGLAGNLPGLVLWLRRRRT